MTPPERGRDGLRERVEEEIAAFERAAAMKFPDDAHDTYRQMAYQNAAAALRRILAEHPATGDEEPETHASDYSTPCRHEGPRATCRICPPASDVDSDNAAAGGAEGLAALIHARGWPDPVRLPLEPDQCEVCEGSIRTARAILASDWLAAHVAKAKAEALREAADALDLPGSDASGYYASRAVDGYQEAERHAETWLRDRADRIGGTR